MIRGMPYKDTWGEKARERSKSRNEYFRIYRMRRDKKKINARAVVYNAVKSGKIIPLPCRDFSKECRGRIEAHHTDYTKPLEVIWLCSKHHREADACIKQGQQQESSGFCACCKKEIFLPKKRYCSANCNLKQWRIDRKH